MIGVVAKREDEAVVAEFFELFKTPWELYRQERVYDVALILGDAPFAQARANLTIVYSDQRGAWLSERPDLALEEQQGGVFRYGTFTLPIYGRVVTVADGGPDNVVMDAMGRTLVYRWSTEENQPEIRAGYNLCDEIRILLTRGQPVEYAECPTLELHIALLRELIVESGIELVEIPPVPEGYRFIACLTHDVDHPSVARHRRDRTAAGFLLRATVGTFAQLLQGRTRLRDALRNWWSATKLPSVYLGWAEDFWSGFGRRYAAAESGFPSTFFVIPFGGRPGTKLDGAAPRSRAAGYGVSDIASEVHEIAKAGNEIGLHGIDAWTDRDAGKEERNEIGSVTGEAPAGVRMHWLYFGDESPCMLEDAGFAFDSTIGYRETCGFKTGTTQVYKPLNAKRLLELPLHAMDTALFYPVYLNLTQEQGALRVNKLVESAARFGGCFTVNWHDRSLAPERNWNESYQDLLAELKRQGAWFATAGAAVEWFRMRREATFEGKGIRIAEASCQTIKSREEQMPPLQLRVHSARTNGDEQWNSGDDKGLEVKASGSISASGRVER